MLARLSVVLKVLIAFILLQTLFFKFTGAQESIDLFTNLFEDNEKLMRIGTGILELIASIFLFIHKKEWLGSLLTTGFMGGAIFSHLTILGIENNNDHGALFIGAILAFLSASILLFLYRKDIPLLKE